MLYAKKEIRTFSLDKEVVQSLFGYSRSFDDYRDRVYPQFQELMQLYRLDTYETHKLWNLGNQYIKEGVMLPVPIQTAHIREEGKIYYGAITEHCKN